MVVEAMHRTTMGVDHDYRNLLMHAFRTSLADGWGGSRIAIDGVGHPLRHAHADAQRGQPRRAGREDGEHRGPRPRAGALRDARRRRQDPEIIAYAKAGAEGVTLAGICCTANEILMRHGIPVAGNFLQQELAVVTGAVEMMLVDVQCCMPSLPERGRRYHTEDSLHQPTWPGPLARRTSRSTKHDALESAKGLDQAGDRQLQAPRPEQGRSSPGRQEPLVAGFSVEAIKYMLGGTFRASFRPLNDAIMPGRIKGVVGIVGCNNPKTKARRLHQHADRGADQATTCWC